MSFDSMGAYRRLRSSRRGKGTEFSVAFLANKEPVDHLEDTYQPVDSFGAQQSNLD